MTDVEDPQGIYTEILEENRVLKEQYKRKEEEIDVESLTALIIEQLEKGIKITGILLAEGMHNGIYYSPEKIKEMVDAHKKEIIGMDMTVEHERTDEYGNKVVGKHTGVEFNPTLKAAIYTAKIDDDQAISDIESGKFKATSMRLREKKVTVGDFTKATQLKPINNTLTQYPACTNCNVFHIENLSLEYLGIKDLSIKEEEGMKEVIVPVILKEDQKTFKCPSCPETFDSFEGFLKHWGEEESKAEHKNWESQKLNDLINSYLEEVKNSYGSCMSKCMKAGGSMTECAKTCKGKYKEEEKSALVKKYRIRKVEDKYAVYEITPTGEGVGKQKEVQKFDSQEEANQWVKENMAVYGDRSTKNIFQLLPIRGEQSREDWGVFDINNKDEIKKIREFYTFDEAVEWIEANLNKEYKEKTETIKEGEEDLRRNRCPYCDGLYTDLNKHYQHCDERKKTLSLKFGCTYCDETFDTEDKFTAHLSGCNKYQSAHVELSEEKKEPEVKKEEPKEEKKEEKKELETKVEEKKVEEPKVEEKKEEEKKVEKPKEKEPEKKEEEGEVKEEKIIKEVIPQKKEYTPKELLEHVKKAKGSILDKAATLLLEREKDKW